MARRFDAPIPITHPVIAAARLGPKSSDARGILQEAAALAGLSDLPASVYDGPLSEWLKLGEEPAKTAYTNMFTAFAVAKAVSEVASSLLLRSFDTDDPLVVDDQSLLTYSSLPTFRDLWGLLGIVERAQASGSGGSVIAEGLEEWMAYKSPLRNRREQVDAMLASGSWADPCFHLRPHDKLSKRGRKTTVPVRARDWGTYIFSWLVGNETLAVRLWNLLALPSEFRWVPEAYDGTAEGLDYAVKKYSTAKQRLAKDILDRYDYVNPMTFQGLPPVTPPPPLNQDTADLLLWMFQRKLDEVMNVVVGRVAPELSALEALALPVMRATQGIPQPEDVPSAGRTLPV